MSAPGPGSSPPQPTPGPAGPPPPARHGGATAVNPPSPPPWYYLGLGRWWWALLAIALLVVRVLGVELGILYDPDRTRLWEILFVIAAAAYLLFAPWRSRSRWNLESGGRFERSLFFLGLPPALIAALTLLAPPDATTSGEPACRNTLVRDS